MKILVAEDDPVSRRVLEAVLNRMGHDCESAEDGEAAWTRFQSDVPDVLITDWMMPGMAGPELCKLVRAAYGSDCYVILLTALSGDREIRTAMEAGADDFLNKPLDFELLVQIVRNRLTQGGRSDLPAVALTDREIETMTWVARGKSSNDIAVLINVSERTVNFHINNAIRKLGVATRVQAAIRCALLGLIDV